MSKNSCRFATSHTRKFAEEVFDGDLATAWAVIPDFMEINSIDDESAINPIQLKAYWNAQSNEEKKRIRFSVPEHQTIENDSDYNDTLGAQIAENNIVLNTIKGAPTIFMSKYFTQHKELYNQPNILQKIVTPDDIIYYELAKVKYDLIYGDSLDDAAKIKMAISDLDSHHSDVGYPERSINGTPYNVVSRFSDGRLASTNKNTGVISIKENISVEEFFDYILGNVNNATSEQKKKVLEEMTKYGVTEEDLRKVVNNPYAVRQFILLHELDHELHASDRAKYDTKNLMGKFQIDVELRANMYAWSQLTGSEMPTIIPQQPERAFEQHFIAMSTNNYADRTRENAQWSDVTLGLAVDFNSAGEKVTAREAGDKYVPFNIVHEGENSFDSYEVLALWEEKGLPTQNVKLNISGNGIYSFDEHITQEDIDEYVTQLLEGLILSGVTISEIRSGGQTGIEEAGIKAAQALGINWNVVATKDFKFRGRDGKDVSDPMKFMSRFLQEGESIGLEEVNNTQGPRAEGREFRGQMVEYYMGNKREDVKATSTFGAIIEGKRTATTRWNHIDYWSKLKVGDIINWKSSKGDVIQVRVTKPATKLDPNTNPETWSKKEGWSTQKYMDDILPHVYKGEAYQIEFEFIKEVPKEKQGAGENVVNHKGKWTRDEVKNDTESLYIFTDNTDRDSGGKYVSDNSWYAKKYGKGHHYPTMTAAVIRGLNNARPISTQRWYHDGAKGDTGRWNDSDIEEFKKVIDDEVNEIIKEWNTGKYKRVVFPGGDGLFYGQISQITKERTPELFKYLSYKYGMLKNIINSGYEVKEDKKKGTVIPSRTKTKTAQTPKTIDIWSSDNNGYERLSNFNNGPVTVDFNFLGGAIGNTFKTVEGAFQAQKLAYTDAYTEEEKNDLIKQFEKADGHTAQALGRSIKGLDTKAWDKDSEAILKYEMEEAFEQNQDARELLLSTGNAKLTHVKGSRGYAEKFPRILMEIRKEYQEANEAFEATLPSSRQESNQQIDPTMVETMPSKEEPKVQEIDYTLPKIGDSMINPDITSPLYRMSLQMDVTQINNRVNMITHRITEGITNAISKKIRNLQVAINNGQATQEDIELWASLVDEEEGRRKGVPLVIDDVLKLVKQDIQEAYDFMQEATKEEIEEEYEVPNGDYARDQYKILLENYDDLFDMACDELENIENLRLSRHDGKVSSNKSNIEENREEGEFGDAEGGERATGNEGYSYSARMLDPHTSSRAVTRRILSNLHQVNYKGEFETDDLGELVYVKEAVAYSSLINDMSKIVHHPTDFNIRHKDGTYSYPALESLQGKYPWIKEILNKLHKDSSLGSALYTDLCKEYVSYWTQYDTTDENGKTVRQTKRANAPVAIQSIMSMVNATYMEHAVTIDDMLWDKEGNINEIGASNTKRRANEVIESLKRGDTISDNVDTLADILNAIGVNTNPEVLSRLLENNPQAEDQVTALATHISVIANGALKLDINNSLVNEYKGAYESIADIIGTVSELANSITFRQGEADFPSYSTPNYIDFIKNGIKSKNWKQFLMEEYAYDDFLYDKKAQKFRSYLLDMLNTDKEVRDNFDIKFIKVMGGKEYQDWTEEDIIKSFITEYNSVLINPNDDHQYAYYAFPIFSDSTVVAFIKAPRFIRNFEDEVTSRLVDLAKQELSRINKVEQRAVKGASRIQRFDATGNKFLFIPALNDVEIGGQPLVKYIKSLGTNIAEVNRVLDEAIRGIMSRDAEQFWENHKGLYAGEYTEKKVVNEKKMKEVKKRLQQFYWNNTLAQSQIIQLMTTDLAYYKDYTEFQKRFKEVYASGARLNTQSKYGRITERVIYLSDKIITSPTYDGIKKSLEQAAKDKLITEEELESILDKFKNINAVDAQAYRTLSSYRAVMDMQGKWTTAMQAAFDRFSQGKWSKEDFNVVWGTIKPFVFANLKVNDGLGGFQRVPHQNKNSEFLLLAFLNNMYMGNIMKNSPQLTGLNRAMETFNIDVAMYESAVKAGGQGIIDISYSREKLAKWNKENNTNASWESFKQIHDEALDNGSMSQEEYNSIMQDMLPSEQEVFDYIDEALHNEETANPTDLFEENPETKINENKNVLHEIPYEHYMIAQPTSNHLVDSESVFGSQFRNLITSDMPDDFEITLGGKAYKAKNAEGKNEILELYQSLIVENLLDDWEKTAKLFGDIKLLHKRLMQMVKGNPSYGPDILNALQLVEIDGKPQFNIPAHNTTVANKIEQLIFSVFKSNITKQYIKGAACVLVSNYGFDNDLRVLRDDEGATVGFECLMPAHTKDLFEDYLIPVKDSKGKVIGQRIDEKRVPKELLEGIGFRIPTESKYSISNLIIKGFLPQQNGAAIMMPAELTQLAGSDFDRYQC